MIIRVIHTEFLKMRRTPLWLAFLVLSVISAVMGTANYAANTDILKDGWLDLWAQHTLFAAAFFLPALYGVLCSCEWRWEHLGHNWNRLMTQPVPAGMIWLGKFIPAAAVALGSQLFIGGLYLVSGRLAGLTGVFPERLPVWLFMGWIGSLAILAVQLFFSMVMRSFAVPVGIALAGGVMGLLAAAKGKAAAVPYALLAAGMNANNSKDGYTSGLHGCLLLAMSAAAWIFLSFLLAVLWLRKKDIAAG